MEVDCKEKVLERIKEEINKNEEEISPSNPKMKNLKKEDKGMFKDII